MSLAASLLAFTFLLVFNVRNPVSRCLEYESEGTSLSGTIKRVTFPGPPNYESIAGGDRPEVIWILKLATPICVEADEMNEAEARISEVQLVFIGGQAGYNRYKSVLGQKVKVTGKLFHAHTGHHHTAVLIEASEIKKKVTSRRYN